MPADRYPAIHGRTVPVRLVPLGAEGRLLDIGDWHETEADTAIEATIGAAPGGSILVAFHGGIGDHAATSSRVYAIDVRDVLEAAYRADRKARGLPEQG